MIVMTLAAAIAFSHADLGAAVFAQPAPALAPGDAAAEIARGLAPRETFRSLILIALTRANQDEALAERYGATRADALLSAAAETVSWRHAAEWEESLAAAYRQTLSADELGIALAAIRRNDRTALGPMAMRVAMALYRNSSALLDQASAETFAAAQARATQ